MDLEQLYTGDIVFNYVVICLENPKTLSRDHVTGGGGVAGGHVWWLNGDERKQKEDKCFSKSPHHLSRILVCNSTVHTHEYLCVCGTPPPPTFNSPLRGRKWEVSIEFTTDTPKQKKKELLALQCSHLAVVILTLWLKLLPLPFDSCYCLQLGSLFTCHRQHISPRNR